MLLSPEKSLCEKNRRLEKKFANQNCEDICSIIELCAAR